MTHIVKMLKISNSRAVCLCLLLIDCYYYNSVRSASYLLSDRIHTRHDVIDRLSLPNTYIHYLPCSQNHVFNL